MAEEIDKYEEDIEKLIDTGKEKGYLTFGEVNDLLPGDITSPDELDDLMTTINTQGIDVLSGEARGEKNESEEQPGGAVLLRCGDERSDKPDQQARGEREAQFASLSRISEVILSRISMSAEHFRKKKQAPPASRAR